MTAPKTILLILTVTVWGCLHKSNDTLSQSSESLQKDSVSEKEIYDFMQAVIYEQRLNKDHGLRLQYQASCDISIDDKQFLPTLLIDAPEQIDTTEQYIYDSSGRVIGGTSKSNPVTLDKCLTNSDIKFMLQQKKDRAAFKWDNSKLCFNPDKNEFWYAFSIPLFSKDRTKAIMMIKDLCQGLCGDGRTILFKKQNNKWISQVGNQWVH
jgi:hypothetical protein